MRRTALQRTVDMHFEKLTKLGILSDDAIREAIDAAGLDNYRFQVYFRSREVARLRRIGSTEGSYGRMRTFQYQNCRILVAEDEPSNSSILLLLRHCQFILLNTLIWKNLQKIRHRELYDQIRTSLNEDEQAIPIEVLSRVFQRELQVQVEVVERVLSAESTSTYFVRRRSLGQSRAKAIHIKDSELIKLIDKEGLGNATTLDVTKFFPTRKRRAGSLTVLVPMCRSSASSSTRSQLLLVHGGKHRPLTQEDITTVEAVITFFLDEVLYERQRAHVLYMLTEIATAATVGRDDDIEQKYSHVLRESIRRVVTDTTAYRCSVWNIDFQRNLIVPSYKATYEKGRLQSNFSLASDFIRTTDHHTSSIAYVMNGADGNGFLLVNNCDNPKADLKGKSIITIIRPSGETQSELSVQLRENGVPFSVIHAESRLDHGFEGDKWFIQTVCALLTEYRRALHQRLDSKYIVERLSLFDSSHDLDVFIDVHLKENAEVADKLRSFLRIGRHDHDPDRFSERFTISSILDGLKADYSARSSLNRAKVFDRIHLRELPEMAGSIEFQRGIRYILKNLISNAFRYESQSVTTIGVRVEAKSTAWAGIFVKASHSKDRKDRRSPPTRPKENSLSVLRIECIITPAISEEIELKIGKRAISDGERGGRRGLYLIGLIVRQLAGVLAVARTSDGSKTKLVIRIPVRADRGTSE